MKRLISLFTVAASVFWGTLGMSEVKIEYGIDVAQNFSVLRAFDLNDDGNNPISTRGDIGSLTEFTNNAGNGSGETVKWFDTLLAFNGSGSVKGWAGNDVSLNLRVVSQFDWMGTQTSSDMNTRPGSTGIAAGPYMTGANLFSVSLNKANVKFDDFLGTPVDLTIGRQNIWLGKGFVMGSRILAHGPTAYAGGLAPSGSVARIGTAIGATGAITGLNGQVTAAQAGNLPIGTSSGGVIHAPQYADYTGFDAVRVDTQWKDFYFNGGYGLVATALTQTASAHTNGGQIRDIASDNDEDFVFANLGYQAPKKVKYPWNAETYFILNIDREPITDQQAIVRGAGTQTKDQIHTVGIRGNIDFPSPSLSFWKEAKIENVGLFGEWARQYGVLGAASPDSISGRDRDAFAVNLGVDVNISGKYTPRVGAEYVEFSGPTLNSIESADGNIQILDNVDWTVWDPVFRGTFPTMIMDFLETFYLTDTLGGDAYQSAVNSGKVDAGFTNRRLLIAKAGFSPTNKFDADGKVIFARLSRDATNMGGDRNLGVEFDANLGYKISQKVRWTLDGAIFVPGGYYNVPTASHSDTGKTNAWIFRTGFKFSI